MNLVLDNGGREAARIYGGALSLTHDCQSCPESNLALARPREWCRTDKNSSSLGWRTVREAATTRCLTLNPQALLVFLHQVVLNSNSSRTHLKVRVMMVCLEGHHCHNKARWNSRQMHAKSGDSMPAFQFNFSG